MFCGLPDASFVCVFFLCFWLDNRPTRVGAALRAAPLERGWAIMFREVTTPFSHHHGVGGDAVYSGERSGAALSATSGSGIAPLVGQAHKNPLVVVGLRGVVRCWRWWWRGISTARSAHGFPRLRCGADNTKAGVSPRVLFRSIGEKMPQRPPMWSCEIRRARPGARAPVVPNQPKPRFYVKIVRSPLLLTKLIYGASPVVVPVGVMQKNGLKSTHKPPN